MMKEGISEHDDITMDATTTDNHQKNPNDNENSFLSTTANTNKSNNNSHIERSTILLLEHINLNIPHPNHAIQLYIELLGCGYDPRRFPNVLQGKGTIWANGGVTQFHLPYGTIGQSIMGKIGIRIHHSTWKNFQQRIESYITTHLPLPPSPAISNNNNEFIETSTTTHDTTIAKSTSTSIITAVTKGMDRYQNEYIEITDQYQNVFYCRPTTPTLTHNIDASSSQLQQPIVTRNDPKYIESYGTNVLHQYIPYESDTIDCAGIDFVEFHCPIGTADKIATFYHACFDVPVQVVEQDDDNADDNDRNNNKKSVTTPKKRMAIIAIGNIDVETGRTDQSLLFREVEDYETIRRSRYPHPTTKKRNDESSEQPNDLDYQYHIAIYVGETVADFQQAYRNCDLLDLIYINPRFSDRADTIEAATHQYQQFRIRHIVDIESTNGDIIMELEHEIRSIHHEAWIGKE